MKEIKEELFRKMRETEAEFGIGTLKDAVIVGPYDFGDTLSGIKYIIFPTIAEIKIGNVSFEMARFFENA